VAVWLVGRLLPASLFSLRLPVATTTAAKTCLAPTPYAAKLALVDAAIRCDGLEAGRRLFDIIKGRALRFELPGQVVVNNALVRVAVEWTHKGKANEKAQARQEAGRLDQWPFKPTVAFREYVYFGGALRCAIEGSALTLADRALLERAWLAVRYIGKRGSFFSPEPGWDEVGSIGPAFSFSLDEHRTTYPGWFVSQVHDDLGSDADFDRVSTFSSQKVREGVDRMHIRVGLPVRVVQSGRAYTAYARGV
jgi:hypothetical protein